MIWAKGTMFIFERGASISDESREFFVAQKLSVSTFLPERVKTTIRSFTLQFQEYTEDAVPRFPIAKEFRKAQGVDG